MSQLGTFKRRQHPQPTPLEATISFISQLATADKICIKMRSCFCLPLSKNQRLSASKIIQNFDCKSAQIITVSCIFAVWKWKNNYWERGLVNDQFWCWCQLLKMTDKYVFISPWSLLLKSASDRPVTPNISPLSLIWTWVAEGRVCWSHWQSRSMIT